MCGIAGVVSDNARTKVTSMLDLIKHRGPDNTDTWSPQEYVSLGHNRLSIVDLSEKGNQPFISKNNEIGISVNGEIYNHKELRNELLSKGAIFTSNSDNEVIMHLYLAYGIDAIKNLNGMFAISIWDNRSEELFLIRDRMGIKPVYYFEKQTNEKNYDFYFSSEIKSFKKLKNLTFKINKKSLSEYLLYQNNFSSETMFRDIHLLEAGTILHFSKRTGITKKKFITQIDQVNKKETITTWLNKFNYSLKNSVKRHLMGDVDVACYLSSGLDSSIITNYAAELGYNPTCFTGKFSEGEWYDESEVATSLSELKKLRHNVIDIKISDLEENIDDITYHLDEPKLGMGSFSQYMVAKNISKTHKVVLTGHGGDELFSGYPIYKFANTLTSLKKGNLFKFLRQLPSGITEISQITYFYKKYLLDNANLVMFPSLFTERYLLDGIDQEYTTELKNTNPRLIKSLGLDDFTNLEEKIYNMYMKHYLNGLLVIEDKISMAHSVESRTPFLDNEMIALSQTIPFDQKLNNGYLKYIIRETAKKKLPKTFINQPKRGFPTPIRIWMRKDLRKWYIHKLTNKNSGLRKIFQENWINQTCSSLLNARTRNIRQLDEITGQKMWQLLSLESWLNKFF